MTMLDERTSVLDAARLFSAELAQRAEEAEQLRTMPADLVARAKEAGLFRLALPRSLGGLELDPLTIIAVVEELCRGDGSGGWTMIIGNNTAFLAWLDPDVARSLIPSADFASTCMFSPNGRALPVDGGGFVLDGRWPFSSGCKHADILQTGMFVMDGDQMRFQPDGRPDWRFAFFPQSEAVIHETWDAAGLRGTGSHDVEVRGLRIPEEHTASPFFEPPRHDGPLWRLPFYTLAATFLAGFPLGVARRAVEEFVTVAKAHARGPNMELLANDAEAQLALARSEARLEAARCLLLDAVGQVWDRALAGDRPTLEQRGRVLLAIQHAMRAGIDVVDALFALSGARTVYSTHPLQRCFRDIHTSSQHAFFHSDGLKRYAKLRLGIDQPTYLI